jgi:hypothetical protein
LHFEKQRTQFKSNSEAMRRYLILLLLPFWFLASRVQAEFFTIKNFHISVRFSAEGYADFEETIAVEFSKPRHGIFRSIPIRTLVNGGSTERVLQNLAVDHFHFSTTEEINNLVIKIGDEDLLVEGQQTYRIRYRVQNPFDLYEDHSEFYWDLVGISWPAEIDAIKIDLQFPDSVSISKNDLACYTGLSGATNQGNFIMTLVSPNHITGTSTKKFMPSEGMTVQVRLPPVAIPNEQPQINLPQESLWEQHGILLIPLSFLFFAIYRFVNGRNPKEPICPEFYPPPDLSPVIAGAFLKLAGYRRNAMLNHDPTFCLIPYLASCGYLRISAREEYETFSDKTSFYFLFYKLKEAGPELLPFEKCFFDEMFKIDRCVDLGVVLSLKLVKVENAMREWLDHQGWHQLGQKYMGCSFFSFNAFLFFLGICAFGFQQFLNCIVILGSVIVIHILIKKQVMKRTPLGNQIYRKLEGFRQFIENADRASIERLMKEDPHYFDKTMLFAMAFGYLNEWSKLFEGLIIESPDWYSCKAMDDSGFANSWSKFSTSFSKLGNIGFTTSTSSGGSSGGGSGGGGGGSW